MDTGQISALYAQCIQLSTNNKINMANSWSLPLIDYIDDVLREQDVDQETNFMKARYHNRSCIVDSYIK